MMFDPFGNYNPFADPSMTEDMVPLIRCTNPRCRQGSVALSQEAFYGGFCGECWQEAHPLGVQFTERFLRDKRLPIPYEVWQKVHPDLAKADYDWAINPGPFGLCPRDDVWESLEKTAIRAAKQYTEPTREGYVFDPDKRLTAFQSYGGGVGEPCWTVRGVAKLPRRDDGVRGDAGRGESRDTGR